MEYIFQCIFLLKPVCLDSKNSLATHECKTVLIHSIVIRYQWVKGQKGFYVNADQSWPYDVSSVGVCGKLRSHLSPTMTSQKPVSPVCRSYRDNDHIRGVGHS